MIGSNWRYGVKDRSPITDNFQHLKKVSALTYIFGIAAVPPPIVSHCGLKLMWDTCVSVTAMLDLLKFSVIIVVICYCKVWAGSRGQCRGNKLGNGHVDTGSINKWRREHWWL